MFLSVGILTGIWSGLLGVGGGIIVVPCLTFIFAAMPNIPRSQVVHMAAGTSLCVMIITALSAVRSRQKKGHIRWGLTLRLVPGILIGVIFGALLASRLPTGWLEIILAVVMILVAIRMFFFSKNVSAQKHPPLLVWALFSLLVGFKSGLLGLGGGVLIVPFLTYCGEDMYHASGTSSSCTLPVGIVGTISFIVAGLLTGVHVPNSTGYIYWPAFLGVAVGTALFAPLGVSWGTKLNTSVLKKIFAVVLVVAAAKLLSGI